MQLRPITPVLVPHGVAGLDILPVDLDHNRGTITRVRLFINNNSGSSEDVTITVAGGAPFVVTVLAHTTTLVLDDVPAQQPDATSSDVQINVQGGGGINQGNDVFVAFGSFVVT